MTELNVNDNNRGIIVLRHENIGHYKINRGLLHRFWTSEFLSYSNSDDFIVDFLDTFYVGGSGGLNLYLPANSPQRQYGSLLPADTYTAYSGSLPTIVNDKMVVASNTGVYLNKNFRQTLENVNVTSFEINFKAANTGTSWISPFLATHTAADPRTVSRFGILIYSNGDIGMYYDDSGTQGVFNISNATISSLIGSWNVANENQYELMAVKIDASSGIYNLFLNGIDVSSSLPYVIDAGGWSSEINWASRTDINGTGTYDDLTFNTSKTSIPEGLFYIASIDDRIFTTISGNNFVTI